MLVLSQVFSVVVAVSSLEGFIIALVLASSSLGKEVDGIMGFA
jgi:hypothetical protein